MHDPTTARADQTVRLDDLFDTRQCRGKVADGALGRGLGRPIARFGCSGFLLCLDLGQRDGQLLEGQLHLLLVADAEGGLLVNGDPVALKQALANLLANAIRLAPPSSTVRVAAGLDGAWVWFAVADEGPGISDEDQVHVFDRFWRGDQPRDLSTSHSGLGLTIVRQIAKGHGGAVGLQSAVGYGSTFSVWLPAINAPVESYSPAPVAVSANVLNN